MIAYEDGKVVNADDWTADDGTVYTYEYKYGRNEDEFGNPYTSNNEREHEELDSSWRPLDLTSYLNGTYQPPTPGVLYRADRTGLFYPRRVHWLHGESESGKSWVAQIATVETIRRGEDVLYIDHESTPDDVVTRLLSLGASCEEVAKHLNYVRPHLSAEKDPQAFTELLGCRYALAVVDGVTEALWLDGTKSVDNDEVTGWVRRMPRRISEDTDAAVVCVDHVTKDSEGRGRFAIGAQAKLAALTGAAYMIEPAKPFARGIVGTIVMRIAKDRPGAIRPHAGKYRHGDRTAEIARIEFDATNPDNIQYTIGVPTGAVDEETGERKQFRPTMLMQKISQELQAVDTTAYPHGYSQKQITLAVGGKREYALAALALLIEEQYVTTHESNGQGGKTLRHRLIRPYRRSDDPLDDENRSD